MRKFRLFKHYDGWYSIQDKTFLVWWEHWKGDLFRYKEAKAKLEELVAREASAQRVKRNKRRYINQYFYPPLPEEEPE